jgi:hypothetical protein
MANRLTSARGLLAQCWAWPAAAVLRSPWRPGCTGNRRGPAERRRGPTKQELTQPTSTASALGALPRSTRATATPMAAAPVARRHDSSECGPTWMNRWRGTSPADTENGLGWRLRGSTRTMASARVDGVNGGCRLRLRDVGQRGVA